jgi:hypothetical protein
LLVLELTICKVQNINNMRGLLTVIIFGFGATQAFANSLFTEGCEAYAIHGNSLGATCFSRDDEEVKIVSINLSDCLSYKFGQIEVFIN